MRRFSSVSHLVLAMKKEPNLPCETLISRFPDFLLSDSICILKLNSRRTWEDEKKNTKINTLADLCLFDVQRQLHLVSPNHLVDILCFCATAPLIDKKIVNLVLFVSKFLSDLHFLSPRKISLGLWAVTRLELAPEIFNRLIDALKIIPVEKTVLFTARDKILMIQSLVKWIPRSRNPKQSLVEILNLVEKFEINEKVSSLAPIEASVCLLAFARLKEYGKQLHVDVSLIAKNVPELIEVIANQYRSKSTIISTESILTVAYAFSLLKFKSQPVLVDLYRCLYSRIDSMRIDQIAFAYFLFATSSGLKDASISSAFFTALQSEYMLLSNKNLLNLGKSIKIENRMDFLEKILNELCKRDLKSPNHRLNRLLIASWTDSSKFHNLLNSTLKEINEFSVSQIVDLMLIPAMEPETIWELQRTIIDRLKKRESLDYEHLICLAREIRKLGPAGVKINLRMRFNKVFVRSIQERMIPTPVLLSNLKLVDDIGAWHCLPLATQTTLWGKAGETQKIDVRPPLNSSSHQHVTSDKLLIPVDDLFKASTDSSDHKDKEILDRLKKIEEEEHERIELEGVQDGLETPISKFIQIVRRM